MIRDATLDDLPALVELAAEMHVESARFNRLRFDAVKVGATFAGVIEGQFAMLAEDQNGIVGGLLAIAVPHWGSPDLVATDILAYVLPEHRGGLAAARLVHAYRRWAQHRGAVHINLGVSAGIDTERVAFFYERLGFARCGIILEA